MRLASAIFRSLRSRSTVVALVVLGAGLGLTPVSQAQVTFSLTPPDVQYTPSASLQTIIFSGTITNLGNSVVYLNDINVALDAFSSQFATPNTYLFFGNVPLTLAAAGDANGLDRYSGTVFGVDLDPATQSPFFGTATLRGGATESSLDALGTLQQFTGTPSAAITPEPNALALSCCGLVAMASLGILRRRKRTL